MDICLGDLCDEASLDAVKVMGLKACVVHPSGILGPNDHAIGETTDTLIKIIKGEMPMLKPFTMKWNG